MFPVKVAVAMAIIKGKPDNLSSQEYAESLQRKLLMKHLQLGNECTEARNKISRLEEQIANSATQHKESDNEISRILTPPLSDSSNKTHPSASTREYEPRSDAELITADIENSKFIKSIISLENLTSSVQEHKSGDVILMTVKENISTLTDVLSRDLVALPESCLCKAAESITNLLHCYPWLEDMVMEGVCQLIEIALLKIKRPSNLNQFPPHREKQSLMQMLITCMTGCSPHLSTIIMDSLMDAWEDFCHSLRFSRKTRTPIDPPVFESSFFIIRTIELTVKSWTEQCNISFHALHSLQERLEKSLLHLTDFFYLVTRAVWRVTAVIERILLSHKIRI